ncbi:hypothetical protein DCS_05983 [Drechmeria coniospora]|uniref:Zn(2)-C6 fungal-type domain-containing protein n=1 Tax=Drechmeria coniospora TaxID=98403 RepID=A0A151GAB5_DRECN|nr:hypothetical protein DCS_05983 [Drechmeria coniospora]KYK54029.1 hypothetical protein DCS_05983 [Drechmeria coniospora]ODA78913.1 hypothetical protein RJ55_04503 [Drechmeria coniospora]
MVTTTCFPAAARRYSSCRTPHLPSYLERKVVDHLDREPSCNIMMDRDGGLEETSSQRKRIAVACGRCRKRKIRCSGDAGNGQPCTNCKNASHAPCQFLRVSSQEVSQVKGNSFSYNIDASRMMQARGSNAVPPSLPSGGGAYDDGIQLAESQAPMGREGSTTAAATYGDKQQYYAPWGQAGYQESATVDYSTCPPAFPTVPYGSDHYRVGASVSTDKGGVFMYLDPDSGYGYTTLPTTSVSVPRPSPSSETGSLPYQGAMVVSDGTSRLPHTAAKTSARSGSESGCGPRCGPRPLPFRNDGVSLDQEDGKTVHSQHAGGETADDAATAYQAYEKCRAPYGSQPQPAAMYRAHASERQADDEECLRGLVAGASKLSYRHRRSFMHQGEGQAYLYSGRASYGVGGEPGSEPVVEGDKSLERS